MIDEDQLRLMLEDLDIDQDKIDEIIILANENMPEEIEYNTDEYSKEMLRIKIEETDDWRKKAKYAARLISLGLEN